MERGIDKIIQGEESGDRRQEVRSTKGEGRKGDLLFASYDLLFDLGRELGQNAVLARWGWPERGHLTTNFTNVLDRITGLAGWGIKIEVKLTGF